MTTSKGKRVLVTAGAGGIGRAITEAFVADGASVFVCDIDETALQNMQTQLPGVKTAVCDIADRAAVSNMVAEAAAALGGLDVLVNNAGIAGPTASVADMDPDAWEAVLRVNLTGTFTVDQAFRRSGRHRGACRLSCIRCRTIYFRSIDPDRRRLPKRFVISG